MVGNKLDLAVFLSTPSARRATHLDFCRFCFFPISIHALREEGDLLRLLKMSLNSLFLSTPSARRATPADGREGVYRKISIHALREEGDHGNAPHRLQAVISIHALREEGDICHQVGSLIYVISIHALREEGDAGHCSSRARAEPISIHALREEGDTNTGRKDLNLYPFLSTPSARRATSPTRILLPTATHFYPRPPRGGRLRRTAMCRPAAYFYPRPPRGGRRICPRCSMTL